MNETPSFGRLLDVPAREAWVHEAHALTPWLAENLDRIGEALGLELELVDTEVRVESFKADIIAQDRNGRSVLIENQLEPSDHTHLGQIMTYLAGLDTQVMVWIATRFNEPHLSAVRWLNEHTVEPFAFFAVRLRVVRIGDSSMAPLFDVLEKPNNWERRVQKQARESTELSEVGQKRRAFWQHLVERYPNEGQDYPPDAASSRWARLSNGLVVVKYLAKNGVGVFVRPPRGGRLDDALQLLLPHQKRLEETLQARLGPSANGNFLGTTLALDTDDRLTWDRATDWLVEQANVYSRELSTVPAELAESDLTPEPMLNQDPA